MAVLGLHRSFEVMCVLSGYPVHSEVVAFREAIEWLSWRALVNTVAALKMSERS
jgi:hypothetical protein